MSGKNHTKPSRFASQNETAASQCFMARSGGVFQRLPIGFYPSTPWSVVSGLRHRLVHDNDGINWSLIADVIFDDMGPFVMQVRDILRKQFGLRDE